MFVVDVCLRFQLFLPRPVTVVTIDSTGYQNENFPKLHAVYWCTIHSSHHFDISPLSREIKMKVSLEYRMFVNEPKQYGDAKVVV